jgi:hypothetical protein
LPTLLECATHILETVLLLIVALLCAAWPAAEAHIYDLYKRLRQQRLQINKLRRRAKRRQKAGEEWQRAPSELRC